MGRCVLISFIFLFIYSGKLIAQCTALGQNPETAFPVCGTTVFNQSSVPVCNNGIVASRCTDNQYPGKNPFWYKFTCFVSGTLGFLITPNTISDDYDWQLFDVNGRPATDVYTDVATFVASNWSGDGGLTGASAAGNSLVLCEGPGVPLFSAMPNIIEGHHYLLLISHFTNSQSGYSLSFGGGSGSITDPTVPKMKSAVAPCDGSTISVSLNKEMKCSSISSGEFTIEPALATVTAVSGDNCSNNFDMEKITLTLSSALPPGTYKIRIHNGSDGNTLKDNCELQIPENDSVQLVLAPVLPTPMDSLTRPGCAPQTLELVFRKNIRCSSIAADGSDFVVSGSYPVTVTGASGVGCDGGLSSKILVQLNAPLQTNGNFIISLAKGSDGNTILDECALETPLPQALNFIIKDTVNADFSSTIFLDCKLDSIQYSHNGSHGVNSWLWDFDGLLNSPEQSPLITYNTFGTHQTQLIVSNGVCSDTTAKTILLNNTLKAKFDASMLICPRDPAIFKDLSTANQIASWSWDFANGNTSNLQNPPQQFYIEKPVDYYARVQLIIQDTLGCRDTAALNINILHNCYVAVPSAFTPNGDGLNDYLYPINAYKSTNMHFSVYNRFGQRIFYSEDWKKRWDGSFKGQGSDPGTYVWVLDFFNLETNLHVFQKGTTILIR